MHPPCQVPEAAGTVVLVNAALVGVPAAYAASGSVAVTVVAGAIAALLAVADLRRRSLTVGHSYSVRIDEMERW